MKSLLTSAAVLAIAATALTTSAISQTGGSGQANPPAASGPGAGPGSVPGSGFGPGHGPRGPGGGHGMMMGPGMMGRGGMGAMCDPRGAGLAEWRFHADLLQSKIREILDAMQEPCLDAG